PARRKGEGWTVNAGGYWAHHPPLQPPAFMLQSSHSGATLTLTLDRPDRRNALSADLVAALRAALAEAAEDDAVRVVVLTGAGRAFSAGADLAALQALQAASAEANLADSDRKSTRLNSSHVKI